jgi:hypothetical protein
MIILQSPSVRDFWHFRLVIITFSGLMLSSCAKERLADPMCRIAPTFLPAPAAPAACFIKLDTKLLVIKIQNDNGWQLPSGGINMQQSAQCTAHQAVWQNTGLNVEVGQLLAIEPDNMHIYACALSNGFENLTQALPVPEWAQRKVDYINVINPNLTTSSQWSEKSDLILLTELFNSDEQDHDLAP